ncbi:MAG TPA: S41 family peptidase [Candidatus Saccharimonadales bacterium]|jgi:carboxyl-terminal processing protease|nr:S41 family peptidase [Candidatus Saccharimonadales bacterium]
MSRSSRRSSFAVLLVILVCGFLGLGVAQRSFPAPAADTDVRSSLKQFADIYDLIEQNYAEPVSADKAIFNGAIPGMLHVLDPHSNFFDPKSYSAMREEQRGRYYGVGMTIAPRNNKIIVLAPFVGTPAYRAGLRPGDVIIAVDGKATDNMNAGEVADLLKGPKGTNVHISILREGAEKPLEFSVTRDEIPRDSVDLKFLIRPGIGYMHITAFNETTEHEVEDALEDFGELKGMILDLRGNPGGLLMEGVGVADKFLKRGQVIVSHHGRSSPENLYRAAHGNAGKDYPLVVLVNRGTASAAEIVSGAIQDHDRGLIAGETTFGKGLVQTVFPLSGNAALALTTAKYYTPSGRLIQRDYSSVSLYEYYFTREDEKNGSVPSAANKEVKLTDSGRTVYGGGGINPDIKINQLKTSRFEDSLLQKYAFFNFAARYIQGHTVDKTFEVSDSVLQDFRKFLEAQKVPYTEAEVNEGLDWIKTQIKAEMYISQYGQQEGLRVRAENDPQIISALNLLPKAKELADNAKRVLAQRAAAVNGK